MNILTRDYELSVWDYSQDKEKKVAIIGSSEMYSKVKAQEVTLIKNINGTKTLKFYFYFDYIDEDGIRKTNPFYSLLDTDTKLKLKWKDRWYEFVIKSISETTENKKISYVAEDAFITELSKRGFDVELSTELENNQGDIFELGERILKKSDWKINKNKSQVKPQILEEVLVELKVTRNFYSDIITNLDEDDLLIQNENVKEKIKKDSKIYCFISSLKKEDPYFQFYYLENQKYEFSDDGFLINCPLYVIETHTYSNGVPKYTKKIGVTSYRGKRLIRTQKSYFDPILQKYIKIYKEDGNSNLINEYTETEYFTSDYVTNLVTNETDFISDIGWYSCLNDENEVEVASYPDASLALELLTNNTKFKSSSYLRFNFNKLGEYQFYNTGFDDNKEKFQNGLQEDQVFVIKLDFYYSKSNLLLELPTASKFDKTTKIAHSCFKVALASYEYGDDGNPVIQETLFETKIDSSDSTFRKTEDNYYTAFCTNKLNLSKNELLEKKLGFFFAFETSTNSKINNENIGDFYFFIKDIQIFEFKDNGENGYYTPKDSLDGEAKVRYNYFYDGQVYKNKDDIKYITQTYKPKNFEKVYYDNFKQVKTIEGKESNYFNLLQTLAENFECWVDFLVEHDNQGYLKFDSENKVKKEIVFKPFLGKKNWAGFKAGLNLKQINREINNSQIITKTIVKPNSNEFAPNGFCTIAYSDENPSGESFIYNFSYYENKGLIDKKLLNSRLYGDNGLYDNLKKRNKKIQKLIDDRAAFSLELTHLNSQKQVLDAKVSELSSLIADAKKDFRLYTGIAYNSFLNSTEEEKKEFLELSGANETVIKILDSTEKLDIAKTELEEVSKNYDITEENYEKNNIEISQLTEEKEKLIFEFEKKYNFYIREGVWISEDHTDHDLYYADAKAVAATSANPQIVYNIEVLDIGCLEEFINYNFDLGDKTYISDPEFFGYIYIDGQKTPRVQEIIISETKEALDSPEKNQIVVQNYKTQFEDLFQRITATTQQLKLNEGSYNRAANAFGNDGISEKVIEKAFGKGNFSLYNNSIDWTEDGIITYNTVTNHDFIKISDGKISISQDGATEWVPIITPQGINANYIYTGQLDAGVINIVSELKKNSQNNLEYALTMDKDGLTMYSFLTQKIPRIRLGKILESNSSTGENEELYGLQLYNSKGEQTFRTDSNGDIIITGTIFAKDGTFSGKVTAKSGQIGGWIIDENSLIHKNNGAIDSIITTKNLDTHYAVNSYSSFDWRLLFGINGIRGNFGVTSSGNLYANGVDIKDGNISFGDIFKITTNKTEETNGNTLGYGLNIKLNPENEEEEIVIESDDRVIGIREKLKDENGNIVKDEDGKDKWTWKTVLGDLTNVTLGGKKVSDLGLTGYGLCTENGLFSGTVYTTSGKIGNWEITETSLTKIFEKTEDGKIKTAINIGSPKFNGRPIYPIPRISNYIINFKVSEDKIDDIIEVNRATEIPIPEEIDSESPEIKVFFPRIKNIDSILDLKIRFSYIDDNFIQPETEFNLEQVKEANCISIQEYKLSSEGENGALVIFSFKNLLSVFNSDYIYMLEGNITLDCSENPYQYSHNILESINKENYKIPGIKKENDEWEKEFLYYQAFGIPYSEANVSYRILFGILNILYEDWENDKINDVFQIYKEEETVFSISRDGEVEFQNWKIGEIKETEIKTGIKISSSYCELIFGSQDYTNYNFYPIDVIFDTTSTKKFNLGSEKYPWSNLYLSGDLNVGGDLKLSNNLYLSSSLELSKDLIIGGNLNINGKITSNGNSFLQFKSRTVSEVGGTYNGLFLSSSDDSSYIRTTKNGILPYYRTGDSASDSSIPSGGTNSNIGTAAWKFNNGYFKNLFTDTLNGKDVIPYEIGDTIELKNLYLAGYNWGTNGLYIHFTVFLDKSISIPNNKKLNVSLVDNNNNIVRIYSGGGLRLSEDGKKSKLTEIVQNETFVHNNCISITAKFGISNPDSGVSTGIATGVHIKRLKLQLIEVEP